MFGRSRSPRVALFRRDGPPPARAPAAV